MADPSGPLSVLVVDGEGDPACPLATWLQHWGHRTAVAGCGEDAILEADRCKPDVVILELWLPDMSGQRLAERLRELPGLDDALLIVPGGSRPEEPPAVRFVKATDSESLRFLLESRRPRARTGHDA